MQACQPIQAVTLRPGVPVVCTQAISHAAKSSAISVVVAGMALAGFIDAKCAMAYDMAASEGLFTSKCAGEMSVLGQWVLMHSLLSSCLLKYSHEGTARLGIHLMYIRLISVPMRAIRLSSERRKRRRRERHPLPG